MNDKTHVIGVDLGGTNTVFGLVDGSHNIVATDSIPTQKFHDAGEFADQSAKAILQLARKAGGTDRIRGIGIGAPCGNFNAGTIEHAANLAWAKGIVPICEMLQERLDIQALITNDAKAAAMGEMKYGAARGMKNFIEITLGTGVGSGIVADGRLLYGSDGFAGELGHTIFDFSPKGRPCGCGRSGCLDMYCSSRGVVITAGEILSQSDCPSTLRQMDGKEISPLDIFNAAEQGDLVGREVFRKTGEILGMACANFATFLSPEAFVFFGGVAKAGHWLLDPAKETYDKYVLSLYKDKAEFLVSSLDDNSAAILGAAALVP